MERAVSARREARISYSHDEETVVSRKWKVILIVSLLGNMSIGYVAFKALKYRAHINEYLDKYTHVVEHFSRRDRYAQENEGLTSDTTIAERIVFLGSQVIENWALNRCFPGYEAINRGVSGQRVSGFLLRFMPDVIELGPAVVVIEVSSYNFRPQNSVKEIEDYVSSMSELARAHGIRPLAATIIPPCRGSVDLGEYLIMDSIALFNDWLRQQYRQGGPGYVDFDRALAGDNGFMRIEYAGSAIDLNENGYERISAAVREAMDKQR